jgi:hypothetical protein
VLQLFLELAGCFAVQDRGRFDRYCHNLLFLNVRNPGAKVRNLIDNGQFSKNLLHT